jgi:hypothetical protein
LTGYDSCSYSGLHRLGSSTGLRSSGHYCEKLAVHVVAIESVDAIQSLLFGRHFKNAKSHAVAGLRDDFDMEFFNIANRREQVLKRAQFGLLPHVTNVKGSFHRNLLVVEKLVPTSAAATTVPAAPETATILPGLLRFGFGDIQLAAFVFTPAEALDAFLSLVRRRHFHECKSFASSGVAISDDFRRFDSAELRKQTHQTVGID